MAEPPVSVGELVERLLTEADLKRDCTVCDGDGIKDSGRPCGGCGQTGKNLVHGGPVRDMMIEAASALTAANAGLEEARELLIRAQLNVPSVYVNWHADARAALASGESAMRTTLKPCPFCGARGDELMLFCDPQEGSDNSGPSRRIQCAGCNIDAPFHDTEAEAIEAWNLRLSTPVSTPSVDIVERLQRLAAPTRGYHDSGFRTIHSEFCAKVASALTAANADRDRLRNQRDYYVGRDKAAGEMLAEVEADRDRLARELEEAREALGPITEWMNLWDRVCDAADPDDATEPPPWSEVRKVIAPDGDPEGFIDADYFSDYMHATLVDKVRDFIHAHRSLTPTDGGPENG